MDRITSSVIHQRLVYSLVGEEAFSGLEWLKVGDLEVLRGR